jgi:hypothetical protein
MNKASETGQQKESEYWHGLNFVKESEYWHGLNIGISMPQG